MSEGDVLKEAIHEDEKETDSADFGVVDSDQIPNSGDASEDTLLRSIGISITI